MEKVPRYDDVGYVIALWSAGQRVLDRLALGPGFRSATVPVNTYSIHADGGKPLRQLSFSTYIGDGVPRTLKRRVGPARIPAALQRFVRRRRARVDAVQKRSRWLAANMVRRTRLGTGVRNAIVRAVPESLVLDEITRWTPRE